MIRVCCVLLLLCVALPQTAAAQALTARLAWSPSSGSDVVGYIVEYGTSPGASSKSVNVGDNTEYTITGLTDRRTYYFAVRAYDSEGTPSPRSNEVAYTTPGACSMSFSISTQTVGAAGGAGDFGLTTGSSCSWAAGSSANWLTLAGSNTTGTGSRTVSFTIAPNRTRDPRIGIIYSGVRSVIVFQLGRVRGDFSGDGRNDLIWQNGSTGEVSVWRMKGLNIDRGDYLTPGNVLDTNWKIMGTLDADQDGHTDLVFQHDDGRVAIWRMNGETRVENVILQASMQPAWRIVGTGDMDGDDFDDIIWQHQDGRVAVWYMDGLRMRESAIVATVSDARWRVAAVEDFNYDGKLDILWRHTSWGQFLVWHMDNRQYVSSGMHLMMANSQWQVAGVGDFNGDGKPDLIWSNSSTGELATWLLDGARIVGSYALNPGRISDTNWRIVGPR